MQQQNKQQTRENFGRKTEENGQGNAKLLQ